jgi:uncharacterized protein
MRRAELLHELSQRQNAIKAFGVEALFLFGSFARDEAVPGSDIDVFIDRKAGQPFGFLELTNLEFYLSDLFQINVDVMTRTALHPDLRHGIEAHAIKVF